MTFLGWRYLGGELAGGDVLSVCSTGGTAQQRWPWIIIVFTHLQDEAGMVAQHDRHPV
jgi:hypothetical protein